VATIGEALHATQAEPAPRWSLQPSRSAADRALLLTLLIGPTILQRFALPFANSKISICTLWFYGTLALLLLLKRNVVIDSSRLVCFGAFIALAITSSFINRDYASTLSFVLLVTIYAPFALRLDLSGEDYRALLKLYQGLALACVAFGALQFGAQFVFGAQAMFPFDHLLPDSLFIKGFNLRIPVAPGAPYLKSTGLWFLEPSHFSQISALSLIIEALFFRRLIWLAGFGGGVFLSFSGTGIMLLMVIAPLVLLKRRSFAFLALGLVAGIVALTAGEALFVSAFTDRINTFSNTQSSAYARFIAPVVLLADMVSTGGIHLLFGYGAGTMDTVTGSTDFTSHDTSWIKLVHEYGVLGAAAFLSFYVLSVVKRAPSPLLAAALLVEFLFLGGYLLSPYIQIITVVLGVWPRLTETPSRARQAQAGQ
jgi:hypothetical protein